MKKIKLVKEDFTKRVFSTENDENLVVEFLDAFEVKGTSNVIPGKGLINLTLVTKLFEYLEGYHIPTYFVKNLEEGILIKNPAPLPFKVVVSNFNTPALHERFGMEVDKELSHPVVELFLKESEQEYPLINASHAIAFSLVNAEDMSHVTRLSTKINAVLKSFFLRREMKLISFELEYGISKKKVMVNSELTLDTISLIDLKTSQKLDKSFYEQDKSDISTAIEGLQQKLIGENNN